MNEELIPNAEATSEIDIADLLLPIPGTNQCGENLKYDYIYDQIKELRREDDPRLSMGIWQIETKKADWQEVDRVCSNLLKTKTKDLQVALWLMESWIVTYKFYGLRCGLSLILALCERFWDDIYPHVDKVNNDFTARLSPFYFLAEKMQDRIVLIPIAEFTNTFSESRALADWIAARHNLRIKNFSGLSLSQLKKEILSVPSVFFQNLKKEVELVTENLKQLDNFITAKCGKYSPSFRELFSHLEDIRQITTNNITEIQIVNSTPTQTKDLALEEGALDVSNMAQIPIVSQEFNLDKAYASMEEIAEFLEKNQPQSPAATLIKIAGAIGKKNFQELMEINMKSGASIINIISELYRVLCIKQPKAVPPDFPSSGSSTPLFPGSPPFHASSSMPRPPGLPASTTIGQPQVPPTTLVPAFPEVSPVSTLSSVSPSS
ncbi:MAG: type VI secretion system protein TssA [Holosporaceae bacterium]|nr:type VI secretion system protein TssA [Holosporaceae bacterium]